MPNLGDMIVRIVGDNAEFDSSIDKSQKKFDGFEKSALRIGKSLTKFVTLPLAGIGAASVKAASDAEETAAKFGTAFRDVRKAADITADNLAKNYGLSNTEAQRLLSGTGDLLKGFGATGQQALDLSEDVQQLAVDLASYNNIQGGASRASEVLTKAMLGERDALVSLGVKVSEEDVKARLLADGLENLEGRALLLAKAQATLQLVTEQSGDAMGDFARTSDSFANRMRIARAELNNTLVTLGNEFLPVATKALGRITGMVRGFNDLTDSQRKTVITVGIVAAAIGPLLIVISKMVAAFRTVKTAITAATIALKAMDTATKTTVAGLALAGISLLVGALVSWKSKTNEQKRAQEELTESLSDTNEEIYLSIEAYDRAVRAALAQQISAKQIALNQLTSVKNANAATRAEIVRLKEEIAGLEKQLEDLPDLLNRRAGTTGAGAGGLAEGIGGDLTDLEARKEAMERISAAITAIDEKEKIAIRAGEEYNAVQEKRAVLLDEINTLIEEREFTAEGDEIAAILDEYGYLLGAYEEQIAAIEELEEKKAIAAENEQTRIQNLQKQFTAEANAFKSIQDAKAKWAEDARNREAIAAEEAAAREKAAIEETERIRKKVVQDTITGAISLATSLVNLETTKNTAILKNSLQTIQAQLQNELDSIETSRQRTLENIDTKYSALSTAEKDYNKYLEQKEKERYESLTEEEKKEYDLRKAAEESRIALREAAETEIALAEKTARADKLAAENAAAQASYEIELELAKVQRRASIFSIAVNTASAIMRQFQDLPFWGALVTSALIGAAGIAQIAAVNAQPLPSPPQLAAGGIIPPRPGGTEVIAAEAGVPEAVIPLDRLDQVLAQFTPNAPMSESGGDIHLQVNLDSKVFLSTIFPATRNRTVLIDGGAVT